MSAPTTVAGGHPSRADVRRRTRSPTPPTRAPTAATVAAPVGCSGAARPLGLRRRILLIFTLGVAALSAFLAVTTYGLVRSNLVEQRDSAQPSTPAYRNAQVVQRELRGDPPTPQAAIEQLEQLGVQRPRHQLQRRSGRPASAASTPSAIPADARATG